MIVLSGHVTFDHLHGGIKSSISVLFICLMKSLRARNVTDYQDGAKDGSPVASSDKTLQVFICFVCFFVVLRVRCC